MARKKVKTPKTPKVVVEESKRQRFVRLANFRLNKIYDRIEQIGHLSNTASYEYTEADVDGMEEAILQEVAIAMARFRKGSVASNKFSIKL